MTERVIVRAYSPQGFYPVGDFATSSSVFVNQGDLIFSVVKSDRDPIPGYRPEREWLEPAEIRLLSALALSVINAHGKVFAYPYGTPLVMETAKDITQAAFHDEALDQLIPRISLSESRFVNSGEPPPILGGRDYEINSNATDVAHRILVHDNVDTNNHLLIRGLGALLKGDLLNQHELFHTESCMSLWVAMEASMHLIWRRLRNSGKANPSNSDASKYLSEAFGQHIVPAKYFGDFYDDRIKTVHPNSRFGVYPDAPLAADDYFDLYIQLRSVFDFLTTGRIQVS